MPLNAEETPKNVAIRLTKNQRKTLKLICFERDEMNVKDWVLEAFEELVRRYEDGEDIMFRAVKKSAQPMTVQPPKDEPVRALRKVAEKEDYRFSEAYYTAVVEYLSRQREEVL
jgi:hypothetical protein